MSQYEGKGPTGVRPGFKGKSAFEPKTDKPRYMKAGVHDCVIKDVRELKQHPFEPTWKRAIINVQNAAGEIGSVEIDCPATSKTYPKKDGTASEGLYNRFWKFLYVCGVDDNLENLEDMKKVVNKLIENKEGLSGVKIQITLGFDPHEHHSVYDPESRLFVLCKGQNPVSDSGESVTADSPEALENFAKQRSLTYRRFPKMTKFEELQGVSNTAIIVKSLKKASISASGAPKVTSNFEELF